MNKLLIVFLVLPALLFSVSNNYDSEYSQRFFEIGKIWGEIKFFSPYLNINNVDWNQAFIDAYPQIVNADKDDVRDIVVEKLLSKLHDPFTDVNFDAGYVDSLASNSFKVLQDSVIVLRLNNWEGSDIDSLMTKTIEASKTGTGLILDLRNLKGETNNNIYDLLDDSKFFENFLTENIQRPTELTLKYDGYPGEYRINSYTGSLQLDTSEDIKCKPDGVDIPIVICYSYGELLSDEILALRSNKKSMLVAQKGNNVTTSKSEYVIENPYGKFRISHLLPLYEGNVKPVFADHTLDKIKDIELIEFASGLLQNFQAGFAEDEIINMNSVFRYLSEFNEEGFPNEAQRILAVIKFYNVIHHFFPHASLISRDFEAETNSFFTKAKDCSNLEDYIDMIKEMSCLLEDSHSFVIHNSDIPKEAPIPIICKWVENKAVVSKVYNEELANKLNLHVGDVILEKDGKPTEQYLADLERYISGSRKELQRRNSIRKLPRGEVGKEYELKVRKINGEEVIVKGTYQKFKADKNFLKEFMVKFDTFDDSILYVNAFKIKKSDVDSLYSLFSDFKKVVFDLRGYPRFFEVDSIFVNLSKSEVFNWANSQIKEINLTDKVKRQNTVETETIKRFSFFYKSCMKYDADIAVLINEDTQSYAEALANSAQYNCDAVLIGSNTAGANQVMTFMKLPGNVAMSFTGANALLWNNKTMQKVGLTPDIEVHPTIKGISEKRDEVLERAVLYLNEK